MKINLTKREIELILFEMIDLEIVGEYEQRGRVTIKDHNTAKGIVDKLQDLF